MAITDKQTLRPILFSALICGVLAMLLTGFLLSRFVLPGLIGEWFSLMVGVLTSPFIMEFSLIVLGFVLVVGINAWQRHREGDEFRYLEQVNPSAGLPEHAQWAIYQEKPLDPPLLSVLDLAEGARAVEDYEELAQQLSRLNPNELNHPEVIRLRISLAEATGKQELANSLRELL